MINLRGFLFCTLEAVLRHRTRINIDGWPPTGHPYSQVASSLQNVSAISSGFAMYENAHRWTQNIQISYPRSDNCRSEVDNGAAVGSGELRASVSIDKSWRCFSVDLWGVPRRPVRPILIGRSNPREHFRAISCDPDVMAYYVLGLLRATGAAVPEHCADGITKFLADLLDPIIGPSLHSVAPVSVTCRTKSLSNCLDLKHCHKAACPWVSLHA